MKEHFETFAPYYLEGYILHPDYPEGMFFLNEAAFHVGSPGGQGGTGRFGRRFGRIRNF